MTSSAEASLDADASTDAARTATLSSAQEPSVVTFYLRNRWTESCWPLPSFDPAAATPPLTLADVSLDSRVWRHGKGGSGPFERVLIRAVSR